MLQHPHPVGYGQRQRPAAAPFPDQHGDDRGIQAHHGHQVLGNGLPLAPFFRPDAAVGPGGVHEAEDRPVEFLRLLHQAQGLAVAFGMGCPEGAGHAFLGAVALLYGEEGHGQAPKMAHAAHDGPVVGKAPVAVQLKEVRAEIVDII